MNTDRIEGNWKQIKGKVSSSKSDLRSQMLCMMVQMCCTSWRIAYRVRKFRLLLIVKHHRGQARRVGKGRSTKRIHERP